MRQRVSLRQVLGRLALGRLDNNKNCEWYPPAWNPLMMCKSRVVLDVSAA